MPLSLYAHPFSSYCQKVLTALYENALAFDYVHLETPGATDAMKRHWPVGKFPVLVDGDATIVESSIIIEYLQRHHPGPVRLLPDDPAAALEVRLLDRVFDNHIMTPMQLPVAEALRGADGRVAAAHAEAAAALDAAYGWLDTRLAGRAWAAATISAWPIAPRRRRCSTPTGCIRSPTPFPSSRPIAAACWRGRRSPAPSTKRGPIAPISRSARPIGIEATRCRPAPIPPCG